MLTEGQFYGGRYVANLLENIFEEKSLLENRCNGMDQLTNPVIKTVFFDIADISRVLIGGGALLLLSLTKWYK